MSQPHLGFELQKGSGLKYACLQYSVYGEADR